MRSIRWSILALVLIVLGFGAYLLLLPQAARVESAPAPPKPTVRMPDLAQNTSLLGPGQGAWVKQRDEAGRLAMRFRASEYTPAGQDIHVRYPEADFFLSDGQVLHVIGQTGVIPDPAAGTQQIENLRGIQTQPPSRGLLKDVRIELLPRLDAAPILVVELPNVAFDDDTSRIYTESYEDAGGNRIQADQVPLTVRGQDYEFDGRGLTIRWSEADDNRLQSLEVAHGGRLLIKHPQKLGNLRRPAARATPVEALMLASTDPGSAVELIEPAPPTTQPDQPRRYLYRASFEDQVNILEGDEQIASADVLEVEFLVTDTGEPATRPATRPGEGSVATKRSVRKKQSATTTRPSDDAPIEVRWTGRLRIVPAGPASEGMQAGDAMVSLRGSPVTVRREDATLTGHVVRYRTSDGQLDIEATADNPVQIEQTDGLSVRSESIRFDRESKQAVLLGAGSVRLLVEAENDVQNLVATWTQGCDLHFAGENDESMSIARAEIRGGVRIEHPQIDLDSETLVLQFDPRSGQEQATLQSLTATGNIDCRLSTRDELTQRLAAQVLVLETGVTPEGRLYPKVVRAEGDVLASDGQQEARAGELIATLSPVSASTTQPQDESRELAAEDLELSSLALRHNVQIRGENGFAATGDQLLVDRAAVELRGRPARAGDEENLLEGPVVRLHSEQKRAGVFGRGRLRAAQADGTVLELTWSREAALDEGAGTARVLGDVQALLPGADGTTMAASSGQMILTLAERPQTAQSEAPPPATQPAEGLRRLTDKRDFLGNKEIVAATLRENVKLHSLSSGPDGQLLQSLDLFAEAVEYDLKNRDVAVPGPGRLLYVDQRESKSAAEEAASEKVTAPEARGATAFAWNDRFVYDDAVGKATMIGGVTIVHEPQDQSGKRYRLEAEQVAAELEPREKPTGEASELSRMRLRRITAERNLRFSGPGDLTIDAATIEYDPATGWLTARGTREGPVRYIGPDGQMMVEQARFNLLTGDLNFAGITGRTR